MNGKLLRVHTKDALVNYFDSLNGQRPGDLYNLVLGQVEEPLFKTVMRYTKGNQSHEEGHGEHTRDEQNCTKSWKASKNQG